MDFESIPEPLLTDCAQLVKANSIEGNKKNNITVVYTPWSNLKKTKGMETGQVGFFKEKLVKKVYVPQRTNEIVNRLNKTKVERENVDFAKEKVDRERLSLKERKAAEKVMLERARQEEKDRAEKERLLRYEDVMKEDNMTSNWSSHTGNIDDDFM
jgi:predicted nucleotidyltransferase